MTSSSTRSGCSASIFARPSAPEAAVIAFQAALKAGDAAVASRWLAPGVLIYEGGGAQRARSAYNKSHPGEDMASLKTAQMQAPKRSRGAGGVRIRGAVPGGGGCCVGPARNREVQGVLHAGRAASASCPQNNACRAAVCVAGALRKRL